MLIANLRRQISLAAQSSPLWHVSLMHASVVRRRCRDANLALVTSDAPWPPQTLLVYVQSNIAGSCITAHPGVTYSSLFPPWLEVGRLRATGLFRATDHDCCC